jgi:hypothetical protein
MAADQQIPGAGDRKRKAEAESLKGATKKSMPSTRQSSVSKTTKPTKGKLFNFVLVEGTRAVAAETYYRPSALK